MNHEDALIYALAGGPAPLEARLHLDGCPRCAEELRALRGVEERLRAAAPEWPVAATRLRALRGVGSDSEDRRRVWPAVAAAVLAAIFLAMGWLPGSAPSRVETAGLSPAGGSYEWPGGEYSTAAVLDSVQEGLSAESSEDAGGTQEYSTPAVLDGLQKKFTSDRSAG